MIKEIPTNAIVRCVLKVYGIILPSEIRYVSVRYECDVCSNQLSCGSLCNRGCLIKEPKLKIFVICTLQDGTGKAIIKLSDQNCLDAFQVSDQLKQKLKEYCLKYGEFTRKAERNGDTEDLYKIFFKIGVFSPMMFFCKPYCNIGKGGENSYNQTIAKPGFMINNPDQNVFLNGELWKDFKNKSTTASLCLQVLAVRNDFGR